ncbi:methylmalonyl Co-A mutase-associated GTPase MeaB [Thermoanaerobacterium sp. DL9XJH110]|uniref:methylmalonyl Co-A mutase-associated GTPase MeaB n=1 Tax=Thermoanaerobacterium sp. DL9XJH110 TaxID=3386643 RepID=UPI003BB4D67B
MDLIQSVLNGDKKSMARLITLIEERAPEATEALKQIHKHTGNAMVIGVTGPPGGGKSSLVNQLAKKFRARDKKVGIIAVDPTSPFTGGALLGDRIRMQDLALDRGVFIRSMGTRGALGGLSKASYNTVKVLDAAGMDCVIIETVGVGQSEVDIVKLADVVILVLIPGMGDDVQAIKAGIMEIGDIFVINKADKDGTDRLVTEIEMMLDLNPSKNSWRPPVIKTIATTGEGVDILEENIYKAYEYMKQNGILLKKRADRITQELIELIKDSLINEILTNKAFEIHSMVEKIMAKQEDPYTAVEKIISKQNS